MKFSVLRSNHRKEQKNLEKLLKSFSRLNPNVTFIPKATNLSHICSNLEDLSSLFLPHDVLFMENSVHTSKQYGFVLVNYKNKKYHIFAKGFEGSYLIV